MEIHTSVAKIMIMLFIFELVGFLLIYTGISSQNNPSLAQLNGLTASLNRTTSNLVGAFNYTIIAPTQAKGSWLPSWLYDGFAWFINGVVKIVDIFVQIGILIVEVMFDFVLIFYSILPSMLLDANFGIFGFLLTAGYGILAAYITFYMALGIYYLITRLVRL